MQGAITLLADKTITDDDNDYIYKNVDNDDDDIYNSDDEENPCLTRLFRSLSNYQQSFVKKASIPSLWYFFFSFLSVFDFLNFTFLKIIKLNI